MNASAWVNPPGIVYSVSYALSAFCYLIIMKKRARGVRRNLMQILLTGMLIAFMVATDGIPRVWFIPCMLADFAFLTGILLLGEDMPLRDTLCYAMHMFILGEFCASLEWQLCYFLVGSIPRGEGAVAVLLYFGVKNMFLAVFFYVCIFAVVFAILHHFYNSRVRIEISLRQMASVLVIGLCVFSMSNISYVSADTPFSATLPLEIFNIHTWVDFGGVAILLAYHAQLVEVQLKIDFDNMQNILEMQYNNYQISKQSVDMVNQKYHDLKHQINILRQEFASGSGALDHLDRMEKEIESYEAQNKTGNNILDTILTGKSLYCQQNDIKMTCVADGSLIGFMDIMDISSLFGNALDNAIESVQAISDRERRLIHLTIARDHGFVRIRVENCYSGELDIKDGLPRTTKKDRNYHGYGVRSIKSVAHKYGGSATVSARDGWFELRVLLPCR